MSIKIWKLDKNCRNIIKWTICLKQIPKRNESLDICRDLAFILFYQGNIKSKIKLLWIITIWKKATLQSKSRAWLVLCIYCEPGCIWYLMFSLRIAGSQSRFQINFDPKFVLMHEIKNISKDVFRHKSIYKCWNYFKFGTGCLKNYFLSRNNKS